MRRGPNRLRTIRNIERRHKAAGMCGSADDPPLPREIRRNQPRLAWREM